MRYETPRLLEYGSIADVTFTTPGGNMKGGGPCYHLDKFDEMSGLSPGLCGVSDGEPTLYDPDNEWNDGTWEEGQYPGWWNRQGRGPINGW